MYAKFKMEAIEQVDADTVERLQSLIDRGMSYEEISLFVQGILQSLEACLQGV